MTERRSPIIGIDPAPDGETLVVTIDGEVRMLLGHGLRIDDVDGVPRVRARESEAEQLGEIALELHSIRKVANRVSRILDEVLEEQRPRELYAERPRSAVLSLVKPGDKFIVTAGLVAGDTVDYRFARWRMLNEEHLTAPTIVTVTHSGDIEREGVILGTRIEWDADRGRYRTSLGEREGPAVTIGREVLEQLVPMRPGPSGRMETVITPATCNAIAAATARALSRHGVHVKLEGYALAQDARRKRHRTDVELVDEYGAEIRIDGRPWMRILGTGMRMRCVDDTAGDLTDLDAATHEDVATLAEEISPPREFSWGHAEDAELRRGTGTFAYTSEELRRAQASSLTLDPERARKAHRAVLLSGADHYLVDVGDGEPSRVPFRRCGETDSRVTRAPIETAEYPVQCAREYGHGGTCATLKLLRQVYRDDAAPREIVIDPAPLGRTLDKKATGNGPNEDA